ncbi:MAG: GIY-YIG nuclease family protein [Planctomycetota bacterium]|jgi:hypothetical protein
MKKCNTCKETKDFTEFNKSKSSKDGLQYKCRACERQYRRDNKKKIAEYTKQYRNDNKDYFAEYMKQYRKENKEKLAEYGKQYREDNKDYYVKYNKLWRDSATPCVYRIEHITSGIYYIGSTAQPLGSRVSCHFSTVSSPESPFTGKDRDNWDVTVLCYGNKSQVKELEKTLLKTRVNDDIKCLNRRIG